MPRIVGGRLVAWALAGCLLSAALSDAGAEDASPPRGTDGPITEFYYSTFAKDALFPSVSFLDEVTFGGASIRHRAVFSSAGFAALADFWAVQVGETLGASSTGFGSYVYLREAQIGRLDLNNSARPVVVGARFDLRGAKIGELHVEDIVFERDVDFTDARFGEVLVLRFATFEGDVAFVRTSPAAWV